LAPPAVFQSGSIVPESDGIVRRWRVFNAQPSHAPASGAVLRV